MTDRPLVDSWTISMCLLVTHDVRVTPATVRKWAQRGKIPTYGSARQRYLLADVQKYLQDRGDLAPDCT